MANKVDRAGTFRFSEVVEYGVGVTSKSKMPTFNVRLKLSEFYDEEENVWVDWSEYDVEQVAYFTLFGKNSKTGVIGPILNHAQIMKVFNWEGKSFQILANDDFSKIKGQIRIEDNDPEYAVKNPFQVSWIDVFDADPVRQLRKLETKELKDLDAQFAQALQSSGKAAAPAAAPGKKKGRPAPPAAGKKPAPPIKKEEDDNQRAPVEDDPPAELTPAQKKAALKAKSDKNKAASKGKKPGPPARAKTKDPVVEDQKEAEAEGKEYIKQEAWEIIVEMKADEVTDEQLQKAWIAAIELVAGDVDDDAITGVGWGKIVDEVLSTEYEDGKTIGKF